LRGDCRPPGFFLGLGVEQGSLPSNPRPARRRREELQGLRWVRPKNGLGWGLQLARTLAQNRCPWPVKRSSRGSTGPEGLGLGAHRRPPPSSPRLVKRRAHGRARCTRAHTRQTGAPHVECARMCTQVSPPAPAATGRCTLGIYAHLCASRGHSEPSVHSRTLQAHTCVVHVTVGTQHRPHAHVRARLRPPGSGRTGMASHSYSRTSTAHTARLRHTLHVYGTHCTSTAHTARLRHTQTTRTQHRPHARARTHEPGSAARPPGVCTARARAGRPSRAAGRLRRAPRSGRPGRWTGSRWAVGRSGRAGEGCGGRVGALGWVCWGGTVGLGVWDRWAADGRWKDKGRGREGEGSGGEGSIPWRGG
jgi:hypothetical protein